MKIKLIGTGLSGLIGSRVVELLSDKYEFENLSLETGVNILDKADVEKRISGSSSQIVLHFAAKTEVDCCEKDKEKEKAGDAWQINVEGTRNMAAACKKFGKKMLHISTDFVFDGKKEELYDENDKPNPISWYGKTKHEAEKVVQEENIPYLICRLAFPYRSVCPLKKDFFHTILDRLKTGQIVNAVSDQVITPTFIDDIAQALKTLIQNDAEGIFHIVGSQPLTSFEIALKIAQTFSLDKNLIKKTTAEEYFKNRAPRPLHTAIKNDKIRTLGVKMASFDEGLTIVKKQMEEGQ